MFVNEFTSGPTKDYGGDDGYGNWGGGSGGGSGGVGLGGSYKKTWIPPTPMTYFLSNYLGINVNDPKHTIVYDGSGNPIGINIEVKSYKEILDPILSFFKSAVASGLTEVGFFGDIDLEAVTGLFDHIVDFSKLVNGKIDLYEQMKKNRPEELSKMIEEGSTFNTRFKFDEEEKDTYKKSLDQLKVDFLSWWNGLTKEQREGPEGRKIWSDFFSEWNIALKVWENFDETENEFNNKVHREQTIRELDDQHNSWWADFFSTKANDMSFSLQGITDPVSKDKLKDLFSNNDGLSIVTDVMDGNISSNLDKITNIEDTLNGLDFEQITKQVAGNMIDGMIDEALSDEEKKTNQKISAVNAQAKKAESSSGSSMKYAGFGIVGLILFFLFKK